MSYATLGDIAKITQGGKLKLTGKNFVEHGYPAYGAGGINGYLSEYEFEGPAVILSANGARCGKCFFADGKWISLANTQVILPNTSKVMPKFLWYQLNDENKWRRAGTAQPFIKPSDVKNKNIYLPDLKEQKRLVDVLDTADSLRQKRKESLRLLDEFLRSAFLDMFGDPLSPKKKYNFVKLGSVASFIGGGTPSRKISEYYVGHNLWATSKDMKGIVLTDTQERVSNEAITECATKLVKSGAILVVVKSKILLRYLPVMIAGKEVCFNQDIKAITPSEKIDPWYLLFHMRIGQNALLQIARGANTEGLTLDHLKNYDLILAPINEQKRFAEIAKHYIAMADKMTQGKLQMNNQFDALIQKYFS